MVTSATTTSKTFRKALGLLAVCGLVSAQERPKVEKDEGILVLTSENYDHAVRTHDLLLVYFFAPWCGHCKALTPEYVKGAQKLREKDSPIRFAKVDGPENQDLLEKMHVTGYPTLIFYRQGEPVPYAGGRVASEMVEWVEKRSGPAAEHLGDAEAVRAAIGDEEVVVVGFFRDMESDLAKNYLAAVRDYEDYRCVISDSLEAMEEHDAQDGQVVLFKKFDSGRAVYEGAISKDSLLGFVNRYALPLVNEFDPVVAKKLFSSGGDLFDSHLLVFLNKSDPSHDFEAVFRTAGVVALEASESSGRTKMSFVTVDTNEADHKRMLELLGLTAAAVAAPTMRIVRLTTSTVEKWRPESGDYLTENTMRRFVRDFFDGKIPQYYKTEDLPEDWDQHAVKYVTGKNFEEVVLDASKTVLVQFYAPWCGHCKKLAPVWEELAGSVAAENEASSDVVVCKMDATLNEIPGTRIQSFPTIRMYKKGSGGDFVDYNGERTVEGITKFLKTDGVYGQAAADHDEL